MAPTTYKHDYYAILQVSRTADIDGIKRAYRRLAKEKHPDKNLGRSRTATEEFQLLHEAYTVLENAQTRREYDVQYVNIKSTGTTAPNATASNAQPSSRSHDQQRTQVADLVKKLTSLQSQRTSQEFAVSKAQEAMNKLQTELAKLIQDIQNLAKAQNSERTIWGNIMSYLYGPSQESERKKTQLMCDQLHKAAARTVKESLLQRQRSECQKLEDALQCTKRNISSLELEIRKLQEKISREERMAREERQRREFESWMAECMRRTEQERRDREKKQEESRKREADEKRRAQAKAEEARKERREDSWRKHRHHQNHHHDRGSSPTNSRTNTSSSSNETCFYRGWWDKTEHPAVCSRCLVETRWHAFTCPLCNRIACARCRDTLKWTLH